MEILQVYVQQYVEMANHLNLFMTLLKTFDLHADDEQN